MRSSSIMILVVLFLTIFFLVVFFAGDYQPPEQRIIEATSCEQVLDVLPELTDEQGLIALAELKYEQLDCG